MTKHWGNGPRMWDRIVETFGTPDASFGSTDGIPEGPVHVDLNTGYNWLDLPFEDDQFEFGFAVDWMRKDLGICFQEAKNNGARLPATSTVDEFYAKIQASGGNRWDTSSLIRLLHD